MGEVWRGSDQILGRPVAIKMLAAMHAGDEQFRARFRAEARYASSLAHPGITRVFDYGEHSPLGGPYLVMELVDGQPLSEILERYGRLDPYVVLDIVAQAARGAGRRAPGRHRAPGHQAGQPADHGRRHDQDHRLRHRQGERARREPDRDRHRDGHGAVRVARAGDRRSRWPAPRTCTPSAWWRTSAWRATRRSSRTSRWRSRSCTSTTRCRRCPTTCPARSPTWCTRCWRRTREDRPESARHVADRAEVIREARNRNGYNGPVTSDLPVVPNFPPATSLDIYQNDARTDAGAARQRIARPSCSRGSARRPSASSRSSPC